MDIDHNYKNKDNWNNFIRKNVKPASFLQSWDWGCFNTDELGNNISRVALIENNDLVMAGMTIEKDLPFGRSFLYCPRGLVWAKEYMEIRAQAYGDIMKDLTINYKDKVFLRVCPPYEYKDYLEGFVKRLNFIRPKILIKTKEPDSTWVLDLDKEEKEIMSGMHHKTRYNIRLADKRGVNVRQSNKDSLNRDIGIFWDLIQETVSRDKIKSYSRYYYDKFIKYFFDDDKDMMIRLYIAEFENEPLAAAVVVYFGNTATYLYGASSSSKRNLMPNYLLQWHAIRQARKAGMTLYDFWGISDMDRFWSGITRFKKGFGGRMIRFLGSWDYVLEDEWYCIFRLLKMVRRIIK